MKITVYCYIVILLQHFTPRWSYKAENVCKTHLLIAPLSSDGSWWSYKLKWTLLQDIHIEGNLVACFPDNVEKFWKENYKISMKNQCFKFWKLPPSKTSNVTRRGIFQDNDKCVRPFHHFESISCPNIDILYIKMTEILCQI